MDDDLLAAIGACEQFVLVTDRAAHATIAVAIHDTTLGPAHGGIRRHAYGDLRAAVQDVLALASAMTWKCALADVPAGGGKAVVLDRPDLDRTAAYRLVGRTVQELGGRFFTGPDVGTTNDDLRVVRTATRFVAVDDGDGPGDLGEATATGVAAAIAALAARLGLELRGLRVAVQGLGKVGMALCRQLAAQGARLIVSDVVAANAVAAAADSSATIVAPETILRTPCDVFAPCAMGAVLDHRSAATLPARGVCGAANNPFADDEAPLVLHRRGVLAVPDFVANAGALIQGNTWHLTGRRVDRERLLRIGATVGEILDRAAHDGLPPAHLALRIARERLQRASSRRPPPLPGCADPTRPTH